ncbi:hypothetical protein HY523_00500 [Candidatus Berkelbacteria bacterium]|nr:hypothetical protein [Candidatus Berkelbacteria bacterium]
MKIAWLAPSLIVLLLLGMFEPVYAGTFGAGAYLSSESSANRTPTQTLMSDLGMKANRQLFDYSPTYDFTGSDDAATRLQSMGLDTVGVLTFAGNRPSVSDFTTYVNQVVSRYNATITAWEIFNEQDNYIAASDYKPYLESAYTTIKGINSSNKVIVGGLTGRTEAMTYWESLYSAGGWSSFDALGLHPYRDEAPEEVRYNIGDFVNTLEQAANTIRKHGGGKKIWITEFGVKSSTVGQEKQANYLLREFVLARTVPEVEKIIMYRLRDNSSESWGMVGEDFTKRTIFSRYQQLVPSLEGAPDPEFVYPHEKKVLDGFDAGIVGWNTNISQNTTLNLGSAGGYSGSGLEYRYQFTASTAYAVADKTIAIEGEPTGIGIWAKGPETISNLKIRIVDANDETFQMDMGKVTNSWRFFRFGFTSDSAITSWNGNGRVDYPIKFDSILYDRQGGQSSGTLYLDELVALYGATDLVGLTFGSKLVYWRGSGSATATACGQQLTFTETPQTTKVGSCTRWPGASSTSSSSSPSADSSSSSSSSSASSSSSEASSADTSTSSRTASTDSTSQPSFQKEQSTVTPGKTEAIADGSDNISFAIQLKNSRGQVIERSDISLQVSGNDNTIGTMTFVNDHYEVTLKSTKAEEKTVTVSVGDTQFDAQTVTFRPGGFSAEKSRLTVAAPVVTLEDNVVLTLKPADGFGNPLATIPWQVTVSPTGGLALLEPASDQPLTLSLAAQAVGRYTITPMIGDQAIPNLAITSIVVPETTANGASAPVSEVTVTEDQPLALTGQPNAWWRLKLQGLTIPQGSTVVAEIRSDPTYFRLEPEADGSLSGLIQLPATSGAHTIAILAIDTQGIITTLAEGSLIVQSAEQPSSSRGWWWFGLTISAGILLGGGYGWWRSRRPGTATLSRSEHAE